jgi:hypothetical protein
MTCSKQAHGQSRYPPENTVQVAKDLGNSSILVVARSCMRRAAHRWNSCESFSGATFVCARNAWNLRVRSRILRVAPAGQFERCRPC